MQKVRFAVIGTNWITEEFIRGAQKNDAFELTAVYSRTQARATEFASKYNVQTIYTSLDELASSEVVDAVYIASPNACHADQAILLMNGNKHVICEKPLASNLHEVKAMIQAAKDNHVTFMEAMIPTTLPNFQVIKENLHKLGPIRRYFSSFCQYSSRYDAYKAGTILNAFKPELSNGALVDIGIYTLAPLIHLFGKPNRIQAQGYMLASGVDGEGSINLQYDELLGTVMYSKISNSYVPTEIQGEFGSMIIENMPRIKHVKIVYRDGSEEVLSVPQDDAMMKYEADDFITAILTNQQESTLNSWQFSLDLMTVLDEARQQIGLKFLTDKES